MAVAIAVVPHLGYPAEAAAAAAAAAANACVVALSFLPQKAALQLAMRRPIRGRCCRHRPILAGAGGEQDYEDYDSCLRQLDLRSAAVVVAAEAGAGAAVDLLLHLPFLWSRGHYRLLVASLAVHAIVAVGRGCVCPARLSAVPAACVGAAAALAAASAPTAGALPRTALEAVANAY